METPKSSLSYQERTEAYGEILIAEGLASEVRPGLDIDSSEYIFLQGDEFSVADTRNMICKFLALPMYIDTFASHQERISAFNAKSGEMKLPSDHSELYMHNKLRTNRLNPVISSIRVLAKMRETPPELKTFINEQIDLFDLSGYAERSLALKLQFVEAVEGLAKAVLNKMIELKMLSGKELR